MYQAEIKLIFNHTGDIDRKVINLNSETEDDAIAKVEELFFMYNNSDSDMIWIDNSCISKSHYELFMINIISINMT